MRLFKGFAAWRSARRARRARTLDEQAKLRLEREGRGLPGAETHVRDATVDGGFGGPV
jgi:hypothetical protein